MCPSHATRVGQYNGCEFFEASPLSLFTLSCVWEIFLLTVGAFLLTIGELVYLQLKLLAYSGNVHLINALKTHCEQRSPTASKKLQLQVQSFPYYHTNLGEVWRRRSQIVSQRLSAPNRKI